MHRRRASRLAPLLALVLAPVLATGPAQGAVGDEGYNFDVLAQSYRSDHGMLDAEPGEETVERLFAEHFVHGQVGLFEVWFPARHVDDFANELAACLHTLTRVQVRWLEWVEPAAEDLDDVLKAAEKVESWVKGWRPKVLANAGTGGTDLVAHMRPKGSEEEALATLRSALLAGTPLGLEREDAPPAKLLLMPTRKAFVEFLAFVGWARPDLRGDFWVDGMPDWAQSYLGDFQIIPLEYSDPGRPPGTYTAGFGMDTSNPTGMQQQVAQLALYSLADGYYGEYAPPAFVKGLGMNLVIELFGEVNTRIDGDTRPRKTSARAMFVPGGASSGGALAKVSAESRWRENMGTDHFVGILKLAQGEGRKEAEDERNRYRSFGVRSDTGGDILVVKAPFLGPDAKAHENVPDDFQGDFQEGMRAYRTGFMHWLREEAGGSKRKSEQAFAEMLRALAQPERAEDFIALFEELYGAPLSGPEMDKENLEGQFLIWLSKQ